MGTRLRGTFVLIFAFVLFGFSAVPSQEGQPAHGKIVIPKGDPFEHQVPLPPDVLKALLNDDAVTSSFARMTDYQRNNPAELFFASEARLGRPDEVDYVVGGMMPLCGVSFDWYWVVRPTARRPEVVLFATGNVMELMETRAHGYRDIRTVGGTHWETDESVYRFDGKKYKLWKKRSDSRH